MNSFKFKIVLSIVCVTVFIFGFVSVIYITLVTADKSAGKHTDKNLPLYSLAGVVVDEDGKVYYGNSEYNVVQVYDNEGSFQYYFSFPNASAGYFYISLGENNCINIAVSREEAIYVYRDGLLVEKNDIDPQHMSNILNLYKAMQIRDYQDNKGNIYRVSQGKTVGMYDGGTGAFIREINPNTPVWPLSLPFYVILSIAALFVLLFVVFKIHVRIKKPLSHSRPGSPHISV